MKLHKTGMLALAASITMSGFSMLSAPAKADVSYDDLLKENGGDLERSHWAAEAIEQLVDKYGIMSGYPDKTFRGQRTLSRFEMAAALYQVMKYIDSQIAEVKENQGGEPDLSAYATKDDLKQLAALQMEFKRELDMLKEGHMDLAKRVDMLERVQVHGRVAVKYRDRVSVTDGTVAESPLFKAGNSSANKVVGADGTVTDQANAPVKAYSNNNGQAVRDANGLPTKFSSPMEANVTIDDLVPFRVQSSLMVNAMLTDGISLHTSFDMFELGTAAGNQAVTNGGHNQDEGSAAGGNFLFRKAMLQFGDVKYDGVTKGMHGHLMGSPKDLGSGTSFKVGLMNFAHDVNPGSMLNNHFNNPNWAGRGYGMVGWGGADSALSGSGTYTNSLSRYWAGGLNASMVDPDSHRYNNVTSPSAAFNAAWGWGKFFVGANYGSVNTNRQMAAAGNLGNGAAPLMGTDAMFGTAAADRALFAGAVMPGADRLGKLTGNTLALPSQYGDGYAVAGVDLMFFKDAFPVRLGVHGMSYLNDNMLSFNAMSRNEVSGVLDLGWSKNFGLTVGVNKSFSGYDRHSVGLLFNDLGGSGFDIQLGANLATRGLFAVSDIAAGNAGIALGIPFVNMGEGKDNVKLVLAARQSIGDNLGGAAAAAGVPNQMFKDSGLTVSLPYSNIGGSPLNIRAEYSMLLADAVWQFRPVAHDVSVITSYWF